MPPAIPEKIPCASLQSFQQELSTLSDALSVTETEETWDSIERALIRFNAIVKGGGFQYEKELVDGIKGLARAINSAMNSERTRLSAAALECLTVIAPRIGLTFDTLVPFFIPHILRLSNRTNKVYVTRSQASVALIINYCHIPSLISHLLVACKESKIVTGRVTAIEGIMRALNKWDWTQKDIKAKVADVEEVIILTGTDKDAVMRQTSRKVFEAYKILFPERVEEFTAPLTPVIRKYLDITPTDRGRPATKPNFSSSTSAVTSTTRRTVVPLHSRSASLHAAKRDQKANNRHRVVPPERSMPPPPSLSSHANQPRTRTVANVVESDENGSLERERVVSNASSTFSVKSAPSNTRPVLEHKPPARLASSQSRISPTPISSGPPLRVRRVISVEPHPANVPDLFAVARKAVVCPPAVPGATIVSSTDKSRNGQDPTSNALGIAFPSIPYSSGPVMERRGPQRVPKPGRLPPQPAGPVELSANSTKASLPKVETESKADVISVIKSVTSSTDDSEKVESVVEKSSGVAPKTSKSSAEAISKRQTKPSVFHRVASTKEQGTSPPEAKEGFVPRRGGLMQPTLSQLGKQKPPVANAPPRARVMSSLNMKRPVIAPSTGKTSSNAKTVRNTTAKLPMLKVVEVQKNLVVPIPTGPPIDDRESKAYLVPLPASPDALQTEYPVNTPVVDSSTRLIVELVESGTSDICKSSAVTKPNTPDSQPVEVSKTGLDLSEGNVPSTESTTAPQTPPFPAAEDESGDDELEDIEFVAGPAYDPSGMPIKSPCKVSASTTDAILSDRTPLMQVVLNG